MDSLDIFDNPVLPELDDDTRPSEKRGDADYRGRLAQAEIVIRRKVKIRFRELDKNEQATARRMFVEEAYSIQKLAELFMVVEQDLYDVSHRYGWKNYRKKFLAAKQKSSLESMEGVQDVAQKMVEAESEQSRELATLAKENEIEALKKKNRIQSAMLDHLQNNLAVALGIHPASEKLDQHNPELALQNRMKILSDREYSSNYLKVASTYFESIKLQRLIDGQSTSAANKELPDTDDDTQEHLDISPLGGLRTPEEE